MEENETAVVTGPYGNPIPVYQAEPVVVVEDLGETGPIGRTMIDLNKVPARNLNGITRMGLAAARIHVTENRPLPVIPRKNHPGSAKRLTEAPTTIPSRKNGRVGRKEPCPCGSGKKFGKCCLEKLKSRVD